MAKNLQKEMEKSQKIYLLDGCLLVLFLPDSL